MSDYVNKIRLQTQRVKFQIIINSHTLTNLNAHQRDNFDEKSAEKLLSYRKQN